MSGIEVLDLFSAAAGGWSLGMHRAGFNTIAACEFVDWRRALYQENNLGVRIYDDVRTLTADQLIRDLGRLPSIVVGSPPCQDISSANTKGKGVEGERSGLYFEAVRIIGEVRPRWFALENSSNLRTRGADAVLTALEALRYACWSFVVRAGDVGANHERPRCWIIGCDVDQVADAGSRGQWEQPRRGYGPNWADQAFDQDDDQAEYAPDPDQAGQADGCMVSSIRQAEIANDGRGSGWSNDGSGFGQVAVCEGDRIDPASWRSDWSLDDLAGHLQLDDGLSSWLAGTRVALGTPKGTSAASLIVEAFGDAVVPQIPEAIGRAILRTERALAVAYGRIAA